MFKNCNVLCIKIGCLVLILCAMAVYSFPDGAPADTCVKKRPNQPNHGQARPQTGESNPFEVVASEQVYHPGQQISGEFDGHTRPLMNGEIYSQRNAIHNTKCIFTRYLLLVSSSCNLSSYKG